MAWRHTEALFYVPGQAFTNVAGCSQAGEPSGVGDNQTLSLTHARNPLPWCGDIFMQKKAYRDGHKGQLVGPGALGSDSVGATGKFRDMPQALHGTGQRAPTVGLFGG